MQPGPRHPRLHPVIFRLAYLLTGLAIGCAILGAFQIAKHAQAERNARSRHAAPNPTFSTPK